jgi:glycosyltransferase involved in cell wall biosynthesis
MNILLLSNKLPYPPRDGGSIATLNMALGLAGCGCRVSILAINTSKHYFSHDLIPGEIRDRIGIRSVMVNTSVNPLKLILNLLFSRLPYNASRFVSSSFLMALSALLDEQDFDVIQMEGPYLGYCLPLIRARSSALVSLRAHNIEHELWLRNAGTASSFVKRKYLEILGKRIRRLEMELLEKIDLLVPITHRDSGMFREMKPDMTMHMATFGLQAGAYEPQPPPAEFSLYFIGALDWMPNIEGLKWFIEHVWPPVRTRFPGVGLYIAGRNPGAYFSKSLKEPGIHLVGEVEDSRQFMSGHSAMIVPLHSGSGIRVKILEGMALGKTIISTRIGSEGIEARNGEEILLADDPSGFIAAIEKLIENPHLTEHLARNARQFVKEKFDNLAVCQGLLDFYKEQL